VAYLLGDDTAKRQGRLSLNPMDHIDIFGTIILPLIMWLVSGMAFGYAKPVPVNPYNFRNHKRDMGITALAGPVCNILISILVAFIFVLTIKFGLIKTQAAVTFWQKLIMINLFLAFFNLIPFPPLDGSKVLGMFLSDEAYVRYTMQERKGMIIFLIIILASRFFNFSIFGYIVLPPVTFAYKGIMSFMQLIFGL
jgi:Zn-dependent protease